MSQYSQQYLTNVVEEFNNRPRKSFGFRTPAEVMEEKIKELNKSVALQKLKQTAFNILLLTMEN